MSADLVTALYNKLGDAQLLKTGVGGVHNLLAPDKTRHPYVVYQILGSGVDWTLGKRVGEVFSVQVKVVDEGTDPAKIERAKGQILGLLDDATLTVGSKPTWRCRCSGEIPDYAEQEPSGRVVLHGGLRFDIIPL